MNKEIYWNIFEGLFFSISLIFFTSIIDIFFNSDIKHPFIIILVGIIGFISGYFHIFTGEMNRKQNGK